MEKIVSTMDRIENFLAVVLISLMCSVTFLQVVTRQVGYPLSWTEELSRFTFIWLIYIGISMAVRQRKHLAVDIVPLLLSDTGKVVLRIIADIISLVFFAVILFYGVQVIRKLMIQPQYSQAMKLNMTYAYLAPYVGSAMAIIRYIFDIIISVQEISGIRKGKEM